MSELKKLLERIEDAMLAVIYLREGGADVSDLKELLKQIEASTGADRELDLNLYYALELNKPAPLPHYTSSIDAAVALVQKMLPMSVWSIYNSDPKCLTTGGSAFIYADSDDDDAFRAAGASPALALLAAMLRALIKKEERA